MTFSSSPISHFANGGDNTKVDAKTNRRNNLRALVEQLGGQVELAKAVGTDAAYLSQILGDWKGRGLGPKLARRIEVALSKPMGWLDQAHDQRPVPTEVSVHGISVSPESAQLAAEIEKLSQPMRTALFQIIHALVAQQKISERSERSANRNPVRVRVSAA